jgi:hypothetical protein
VSRKLKQPGGGVPRLIRLPCGGPGWRCSWCRRRRRSTFLVNPPVIAVLVTVKEHYRHDDY